MRDLFAKWAVPIAATSKSGATGVTGATNAPKARSSEPLQPGKPVAQPEQDDATDVAAPVGGAHRVTPVTPDSSARATARTEQYQRGSAGNTGSTWRAGEGNPGSQQLDDFAAAERRVAIEPGSTPPAWDGEDWCAYFEERAAIAEHDGGLDRAAAERRALDCTVVEWLNRNPPPAQPDPSRCLLCGEAEARGRPLLPIPTGDGGHRWLRDVCLEPHWRARLAEAVEALARLKIGRTRRNEEQGL